MDDINNLDLEIKDYELDVNSDSSPINDDRKMVVNYE